MKNRIEIVNHSVDYFVDKGKRDNIKRFYTPFITPVFVPHRIIPFLCNTGPIPFEWVADFYKEFCERVNCKRFRIRTITNSTNEIYVYSKGIA
ncbi:MAG: hypothetical protein ACP5TE_14345, partial [Verrucomicrobiia bacterium]